MYILGEYYSDLALNKICFWHFIAMSQSTKRRWNSGPSNPSSTSKKKKYNCKFQDEWKKSHHWLQSSSLGNDLTFYVTVTKKMLSKFPFGDQTLKSMAFLNPQFRHNLDSNCGEWQFFIIPKCIVDCYMYKYVMMERIIILTILTMYFLFQFWTLPWDFLKLSTMMKGIHYRRSFLNTNWHQKMNYHQLNQELTPFGG